MSANLTPVINALEDREIPEEILKSLKCGFCNEFLSHSPITMYSKTGSVCGRCPYLETENDIEPIRATSYEILAQMFKFPCRYRSFGCPLMKFMEEIPEHESTCQYRQYFCQVIPLGRCSWEGLHSELYMHFVKNHIDKLLETKTFDINFRYKHRELYLLPFKKELFFVRSKIILGENMLHVYVSLIGNSRNKFSYNLRFSAGNLSMVIKPPEKFIKLDHEEWGDAICMVDITNLQVTLQENVKITCKIQMKVCDSMEELGKEISSLNHALLLDLECPVCQEHMIPPIFQCSVGHSVCKSCKSSLDECPICRGPMTNTRNFTLEKLTENITYACVNSSEGCDYVNKSNFIREHEKECKFNNLSCPYDCSWIGKYVTLFQHVKESHARNIQNDFQRINFNGNNFEFTTIIQYHCEPFQIYYSFSRSTKQFSVTVVYLGPASLAQSFMYCVSVIDLASTGLELRSKKFCASKNDDINTNCLFRTKWDIDMLKPFEKNDFVNIACKITKAVV